MQNPAVRFYITITSRVDNLNTKFAPFPINGLDFTEYIATLLRSISPLFCGKFAYFSHFKTKTPEFFMELAVSS